MCYCISNNDPPHLYDVQYTIHNNCLTIRKLQYILLHTYTYMYITMQVYASKHVMRLEGKVSF